MLWDVDIKLGDKTYRLPDDIQEVYIDNDPDRLLIEDGDSLVILTVDGDEYEVTVGDNPDLDEALQEILDPA